MKTLLKFFILMAGLLAAVSAGAQGVGMGFESCNYSTNTPPDKIIYYGTRTYFASILDVNGTNVDYNYAAGATWGTTNSPTDPNLCTDDEPTAGTSCDLTACVYACGGYGAPPDNGTAVDMSNYLLLYFAGLTPDDVESVTESHGDKYYSATVVVTNGDDSTTYVDQSSLSDPFTVSIDVNHGKNGCPTNICPHEGMPRAYVSEPYLNVWLEDDPVFYNTSLGDTIRFDLAYKQRDTRPKYTSLPPTGWSHNWFSYVHFVVPAYYGGTNSSDGGPLPGSTWPLSFPSNWRFTEDYSKWQAILYNPDDSEGYYDHVNQTEMSSHCTLTAMAGGSSASGFRLVHPDGSADEYTLVSSPTYSFGLASNGGQVYEMQQASRLTQFAGISCYGGGGSGGEPGAGGTGPTNYTVSTSSQTDDSAIGEQVGYVACDALLTRRVDPYGNAVNLAYTETNSQYYLATLTDYDTNVTTLTYSNGLLAGISMPYGRSAALVYDGNGNLSQITDAQGMTSTLSYAGFICDGQYGPITNVYVTSMTTPYGTTSFSYNEGSPFQYITNPPTSIGGGGGTVVMGATTTKVYVGWMGGYSRINKAVGISYPDGSHELYMYRNDCRGLVPDNYPTNEVPYTDLGGGMDDGYQSDVPGSYDHLLSMRNSFHWNRQQYALLSTNDPVQLNAKDYGMGTMKHWLQAPSTETVFPNGTEHNVSSQMSLLREASPDGTNEGFKTWYEYGNQSGWTVSGDGDYSQMTAARVMPDGSLWREVTTYSGNYLQSVASSYTSTDGTRANREWDYNWDNSVAVTNGAGSTLYTYNRIANIETPGNLVYYNYDDVDGLITESDNTGGTTTNFYNSRHQVTGVAYANGLTITNTYGSDGFLSQSKDVLTGATTTYLWGDGLPTTVGYPTGLAVSYTWDHLSRLTGILYPDGTTVSNSFTDLSLTGHKDRLGNWTTATYDAMEQPKTVTDGRGNTTQYTYCGCGALASLQDASGAATVWTRDNDGNVTAAALTDGFTTYYNRDGAGRVTNVTDSAGRNLTLRYNHQGLVTNVLNPTGTVYAVLYDAADRPLQVTDARGVAITNEYDSAERLTGRKNAFGYVENNTYGVQGITRRQDAKGNYTYYGYDGDGRLTDLTDANGNTNGYTYTSIGQLATLTDGKGQVTTWTYDIYGRAVSKTDGNGVLSETNGYDADGRAVAHWTPAKGLTQSIYDANGNLCTNSYANGTNIIATYDALNRIINLKDAVGTSGFGYTNYGAFASALSSETNPWSGVVMSYGHNQHLPTGFSVGSWSQGYAYDGIQRLASVTSTGAGMINYTFNGASMQVASVSLGGSTDTRSYDAAGQLLGTVLSRSGTPIDSYAYLYDLNGNRTNVTRVDGTAVGYGYDKINQLVSALGYEPDGTTFRGNENFGYGYDAANNLSARQNNTLVQTFTTDGANQLNTVAVSNSLLTVAGSVTSGGNTFSLNGQTASLYHDLTFALTNGFAVTNGLNNFTAVAISNAVAHTNVVQQYIGLNVGLQYDANGNLTNDGMRAYEYDCANELTRVTVPQIQKTEYLYDGFGRRRIRRDYGYISNAYTLTNETRYIYDGMVVVQERDSNNVVQVSYTRGLDLSSTRQGAGGIGGLLARTDGSGTAYYHSDGNGNVTMLVDGSGNMLARYLYDPFGNTLGAWGALANANSYRFSSKEVDRQSGLYYYGFRYYQPNLQRWLNRDPMGVRGGLNLYQFVKNGPISWVDSDGKIPTQYTIGIDSLMNEEAAEEERNNAANVLAQAFENNYLEQSNVGLESDDGILFLATPGLPIVGDALGYLGDLAGNAAKDALNGLKPKPKICPKPSPKFVPPTNPPQLPKIPPGYVGRSGRTGGTVYQPLGSGANQDAIRVMPPTSDYPDGYWVRYNGRGQPVNPSTGGTGTRPETHIPLPPP